MKKLTRILSILCSLCLLVNAFSFSTVNASASSSDTQTVRIRCMWNSNYIYNDNAQGKYASNSSVPETDLRSVWTITQNSDGLSTIRNSDGSYLCASGDAVTCRFNFGYGTPQSYYWNIQDAGDGKVRIISAADMTKAINIENLTGSLQLTTYYDTWESARWILEETASLDPSMETDRVILQSGSTYTNIGPSVMYGGINVGTLNSEASSISDGKFLYRIIEKNGYCLIQYAPINGTPGYLYAVDNEQISISNSSSAAGDLRYRWMIQEGENGSVSIVSYLYSDKCIVPDNGSCSLGDITYGNWCIRSGNSMNIRILGGYSLACSYTAGDENAYFRVGSPESDRSTNWQVIYKGNQFYLKNLYNGKYLMTKGTSDDDQLYVSHYSAANDSQYLWSHTITDENSLFVGKNSSLIYIGTNFTAPKADIDAHASSDSYNQNINFDYSITFMQ